MYFIAENAIDIVKVNFGKYRYPLKLKRVQDRVEIIEMGFNKALTNEMKTTFMGMKWHGYDNHNPRKIWSFLVTEHNMVQIAYMMGLNPYERYDRPLSEFPYNKETTPFKPHQAVAYNHLLTRRQCILAGEMGVGKTLPALALIEYLKPKIALWVAPGSALTSIRLEYEKWKCTQNVVFLTYDGLKKYVANHPPGATAPQVVIFDESHKIKNLSSQRTQAAEHLARSMREDWGDNAYIILMSGSPAPKSPLDWFSQCRVASPGYLKEADIHKFKERLAIIVQKENTVTGGVYPELVTWRDDAKKCNICGKIEDDYNHCEANISVHAFIPSINEVEYLYKRMEGLVLVQSKKDVLKDLPDKIYQRITCRPTPAMKRAAEMITKRAESTIKALMLLRELSDGFQYVETVIGKETCPLCHGNKQTEQYVYTGPNKTYELFAKYGIQFQEGSDPEDVIISPVDAPDLFGKQFDTCPNCNGEGTVKQYQRQAQQSFTAKDKALIDLFDEYDEIGRMVVYAGFTQSIDRVCEIAIKQKWEVIRLDGRGWESSIGGNAQGFIKVFQEMKAEHPRVVFIGNPGSAGTGLTLTASPVIVFYSNDFNADSRIQAEDRIHRMGMDINRGAKIIDLIHLSTDTYVLENLQRKRELQSMSLGQLQAALLNESTKFDYE